MNSVDERGVVEGRWASPYDGGTAPWEWSGSPDIVRKFVETDSPVKYGQCWVFSAVTVTSMSGKYVWDKKKEVIPMNFKSAARWASRAAR